MSKLIQLIGPAYSGKSELVRLMCPKAKPGNSILVGYFNNLLLSSDTFYFEEVKGKALQKLTSMVNAERLTIDTKGAPVSKILNDKTFVYMGEKPLDIDCPSLIWHVEAIR